MRTSQRLSGGATPSDGADGAPPGTDGEEPVSEATSAVPVEVEDEVDAAPSGTAVTGRQLFWPALTGAVGSLLILWGASRPTSPFVLDHETLGTLTDPILQYGVRLWFFGTGAPVGNQLVGVVAVYAGIFLMIRGWLSLLRLARLHPGTPVRRLLPVFAAWLLPLLFVAPLFSHDAFSYVGQGEEMTRGFNPYVYPPSDLGVGGNPYADLVDSLWSNATSPYGPVFLASAGWIVALVNHSELAALVGFRVLAVFGLGLLAVFTPRLARSYGFDGARAFMLVALNPLVLLHLVAGEHNDALMMGLLVAGLALARERHPIAGVVVCTLAGLVKAPALIGVVYIGWDWAGLGVPWRARLRPLLKAGGISGVVMVAVTYATGLGWGWVAALRNPGAVSSWMDPATGLGGLLARLVSGLGLGEHTGTIVAVFRGAGLAAAAVIAVVLLVRSDGGVSSLRNCGLTLLAVVVLGPVVQPWYLSWGVILLAPVAEGTALVALIWLSAVMSYLGLPGGRGLLSHLEKDGPLAILAGVAALLAVGALSFAPRLVQTWEARRALRAVPAEVAAAEGKTA
jgi:hypothetical protein